MGSKPSFGKWHLKVISQKKNVAPLLPLGHLSTFNERNNNIICKTDYRILDFFLTINVFLIYKQMIKGMHNLKKKSGNNTGLMNLIDNIPDNFSDLDTLPNMLHKH